MTQGEAIFVLGFLGLLLWQRDMAMTVIAGCAAAYWGVLNMDQMEYGGVLMLLGVYLVLSSVIGEVNERRKKG